MLSLRLRKILSTRGITLPSIPDGPMSVVCGADGISRIERWDVSALGPRPTQAEIDAVDIVALQSEIAAAETAERERQAWMLRAKEAVQENRQHIKYIEAFLSVKFPAAFQPPTWGE